jgi:hypothetical protein
MPYPVCVLSSRVDARGNVQPTAQERAAQMRTVREHNAQWERTVHLPA